jgi:hypothetical protein
MNREDVLQALARINEAIASLNARLHPPPADPNETAELETELASTEQSRATLEQILNNLPEPAPAAAFAAEAQVSVMRANQTMAHNAAAIGLSKAARLHANQLKDLLETVQRGVEPVKRPHKRAGIKKKTAS